MESPLSAPNSNVTIDRKRRLSERMQAMRVDATIDINPQLVGAIDGAGWSSDEQQLDLSWLSAAFLTSFASARNFRHRPPIRFMVRSKRKLSTCLNLASYSCILVFAGCAEPRAPQLVYSPHVSAVVRQEEWQQCLKQDVEKRVSDAWTSSAGFPLKPNIVAASLERCFPSEFHRAVYSDPFMNAYGYVWNGGYPEHFADEVFDRAEAPYLAARTAAQSDLRAKKAADDQANLKQEEPAILAKYRDCIFASAARLALISNDSAEVLVQATYASCRQQRMALLEVHKRYGDWRFDDRFMDSIERRIAGDVVLMVVRVRAAKPVSPPAEFPPAPTSPRSSDERAI